MEECIYHPFGLLHKDRDLHLTASVSDEARAALRRDDAILANPNTGKRALEQNGKFRFVLLRDSRVPTPGPVV